MYRYYDENKIDKDGRLCLGSIYSKKQKVVCFYESDENGVIYVRPLKEDELFPKRLVRRVDEKGRIYLPKEMYKGFTHARISFEGDVTKCYLVNPPPEN